MPSNVPRTNDAPVLAWASPNTAPRTCVSQRGAARPESAELLIGRAVLRMPPADNKLAEAEQDLRKAMELSPKSPVAMSLLAQCLRDLGRQHEADALLEKMRKLAPTAPVMHEERDAPNAN